MLDLNFQVDTAEVEPFAAAPLLAFKVHIRQSPVQQVPIHSIMLRCQIRIEPAKRHYSTPEQQRLVDLFDSPARWSRTLRPMLWTHANVVVPAFTDQVMVDLPAPCTFDFNVAATKYFYALEDGEAPLSLLFSGTIFYEGIDGLQVAQVPWEKEAAFRLPVSVWQEMMDRYYPNSAWLCLHRDVFDRLYQYKSRHHLPTWEQAVESLLSASAEEPAESREL